MKTCLFKNIRHFFRNQNTLEKKIFWSVVPLAVLSSIVTFCASRIEQVPILPSAVILLCAVFPTILMVACYRDNEHCDRYYSVFCYLLNCVLLPVIFLFNGGLRSGMTSFCFAAMLLCVFCSHRREKVRTFTVSLICYVTLFILSAIFPQIVIPYGSDLFVAMDMVACFVIAGVQLFLIFRTALFEYSTQRYTEMNGELIDSLSAIIEFRSLETGNHVRNIKTYTRILLKCANKTIDAGFTEEDIDMISSAAVLHDIGKIAVPDSILMKNGKLTPEEFEIIKKHPIDGCEMIESMQNIQDNRYYEFCYEICRHHHERYDGTGYPDGLKGDEIPVVSQIVSLADMFEAMTSTRSYKPAWTPEEAHDIIVSENKNAFSDSILRCFAVAMPELKKHYEGIER